jgi:hypothetical protein
MCRADEYESNDSKLSTSLMLLQCDMATQNTYKSELCRAKKRSQSCKATVGGVLVIVLWVAISHEQFIGMVLRSMVIGKSMH